MARSAKKDRVLPHLLRAQNAVRREEDAYLGRLLEKAIVHRAATVASGQPRTSAPPPDKRIAKAIEFIHANLGDRRVTLSSIAAASGMSVFHFARVFRSVIGLTPRSYVLQRRLELAREMLAHRQKVSLANVALKSGFGSQAYFNSAFKEAFGTSPGAFRKAAAVKRR